MPFNAKSGKYHASINTVSLGCGDRKITLGGENVLPFYTFDAKIEHAPKVGVEITDKGLENEPECIKKYYEGCETVLDMAKKAAKMEGADFLCFRMEGADPSGDNKSTQELITMLKEIADTVEIPIVAAGCNHAEKDAELLSKAAKVLESKNAAILAAVEENYKTIGEAAGLIHRQILCAESSVDINLAKQLNVLLSQLGVDSKNILINAGSAAAGYGFEYLVSTMERIKSAALSQNDNTLQMPIITPVASEAWCVKEAMASEADMPEWGDLETRGIDMEIETAAAVLASGSNAVILKHPTSVVTISRMIQELI